MATYGATTLDVSEQNGQAVGFYLHYGFQVVGRSDLDGTGRASRTRCCSYDLCRAKWVDGCSTSDPSTYTSTRSL